MHAPKLTQEHKQLHVLEGEWEGEEHLMASPWGPGGTVFARSKMRVAIDGFFVVQDYVEEKDEQVIFKGHGLFGYDPASEEYGYYWVDSTGFMPSAPARGPWEGDTLVLNSPSEGARGIGRYTLRFDSDRQFYFKIENSGDSGKTFQTFMDATYRKKG